jgi:hypothetical protein
VGRGVGEERVDEAEAAGGDAPGEAEAAEALADGLEACGDVFDTVVRVHGFSGETRRY